MASGEEYLDAIKAELESGHRQWKLGYKLLEAFGYTRRRQTAIDLINDLLNVRGMYTVPELTTEMPLDRGITFYLRGHQPRQVESEEPNAARVGPVEVVELAPDEHEEPGAEAQTVTIPQEPPSAASGSAADSGFIIGNLACADRPPEQIAPTATVEEALTRMAMRDYSQLVVASGIREIKGVISYKSVAQAYLHGNPRTVNDCLDTSVPTVDLEEPVLRVVERFHAHSAVLIVRPDRTLAGIVTPADIAAEFGAMAAPFFLIGQIEEQLKWLVQNKLPDLIGALASAGTAYDGDRPPVVADFTMGDLHRILDNDDNWSRIGIRFDRVVFCKELNTVREIRNAVMHFREVPSDAAERLERFADVVKTAYVNLTA